MRNTHTCSQGIVFFSVINRVGRGVSHGDPGTNTDIAFAHRPTRLNFNSRDPSTGITVETSTELHALDSFPVNVRMRPDGTVVTGKTLMTGFVETDKPRRSFGDADPE